ncbi:MAG: fumarylacetoacetate hydrolase family protein [Paracoccaceae bacterium]
MMSEPSTDRLASVRADGRMLWGVVAPTGFVALSHRFTHWAGLRDVIAAGAVDTVLDYGRGMEPSHAPGAFEWLPPVPDPEKIVSAHGGQVQGSEAGPGEEPSLFPRFSRSFTGHEQPLIRPGDCRDMSATAALAAVIGIGGRRINETHALGHIAALTLCADTSVNAGGCDTGSSRAWRGNWEHSAAIGPWLVAYREAAQLAGIGPQMRVNGAACGDGHGQDMASSFARLIAAVSTHTTLVPGDIIVVGGAGPAAPLQGGDRVEVSAAGIGALRNVVAAGDGSG